MAHANYELSFEMKITGGTVNGQSGVLTIGRDDDGADLLRIYVTSNSYKLNIRQSCQQRLNEGCFCGCNMTGAGFQEGGTYNIRIRDSAETLSRCMSTMNSSVKQIARPLMSWMKRTFT